MGTHSAMITLGSSAYLTQAILMIDAAMRGIPPMQQLFGFTTAVGAYLGGISSVPSLP